MLNQCDTYVVQKIKPTTADRSLDTNNNGNMHRGSQNAIRSCNRNHAGPLLVNHLGTASCSRPPSLQSAYV